MKHFATIALAALTAMSLTSCGSKQDNSQNNNLQNETTMNIQDIPNRTNMGAKIYITPQPALMIGTYDEQGNPDVMMAAWGGQCDVNRICFSLSPHRTTTNLLRTREFTVSFASVRDVAQSDYFGLVSANNVPDKIARAGFTVTKSPNINAPIINEYPVTLECRVVETLDRSNGGVFVIGEVLNLSADESVMTDGKIDIKKLNPIIFDAGSVTYFSLGDSVGRAWGSGKVYTE